MNGRLRTDQRYFHSIYIHHQKSKWKGENWKETIHGWKKWGAEGEGSRPWEMQKRVALRQSDNHPFHFSQTKDHTFHFIILLLIILLIVLVYHDIHMEYYFFLFWESIWSIFFFLKKSCTPWFYILLLYYVKQKIMHRWVCPFFCATLLKKKTWKSISPITSTWIFQFLFFFF